ncbi:hypothetical protein Tco_0174223 [Tanacetum coccineum]
MVHNGDWLWPIEWRDWPVTQTILVPQLNETMKDTTEWITNDGMHVKFGISRAWRDCRHEEPKVPWCDVVWNKRLFSNEKRSGQDLLNVIVNNIRMKLSSLYVKRTAQTDKVAKDWHVNMNFGSTKDDLVEEWDGKLDSNSAWVLGAATSTSNLCCPIWFSSQYLIRKVSSGGLKFPMGYFSSLDDA